MCRRRKREAVIELRTGSIVFVIAVLVLASGVGAGIGTSDAAPSGGQADGAAPIQYALQADGEGDDNVSRRHRNPREYDERGNLAALEDRLVARLVGGLEDGAISLEDGDYARAARAVDTAYVDDLDRYTDIADETAGDSAAALFELAGAEQGRLVEAARRYNETHAEYERARAAGDESRARALARDLETTAGTVNDSSSELRAAYDDLESATDANLSESDAAVEAVAAEVRREQAAIRETEFVATTLTVEADRERLSFREPLTATGRLRTADGRPVGSEPIRIEVGTGTVRTETAADGSFSFDYRPTAEPLSTDRLEIEYVPANESIYLGSETSVAVSIEQVTPTVSGLETPTAVAYGENATVRGTIGVDGIPVDGVSLAVTLGDERLGTVETTDGSFETGVTVPASVADGDRELGVRLDYENRALAPTSATNGVTVRETALSVSVSASHVDDGQRTVAIEGALETGDGSAVAGRPVRLDAGGATLRTVTTDADGSFTATVELPASAGRDVQIAATHDGSGSNLASDTATATVSFSSGRRSWLGLPVWAWLGLGGGLAALAAFAWRSRADSSDGDPVTAAEDEATDRARDPGVDRSRPEIARSVLEHGRDALSSGRPERAVELGYAAVRHALTESVDSSTASTALTHWEFYRQWADRRGDDADAALLRTVTERYERATFDVADVSSAEAERVLELGRRLCDRHADGGGRPKPDGE